MSTHSHKIRRDEGFLLFGLKILFAYLVFCVLNKFQHKMTKEEKIRKTRAYIYPLRWCTKSDEKHYAYSAIVIRRKNSKATQLFGVHLFELYGKYNQHISCLCRGHSKKICSFFSHIVCHHVYFHCISWGFHMFDNGCNNSIECIISRDTLCHKMWRIIVSSRSTNAMIKCPNARSLVFSKRRCSFLCSFLFALKQRLFGC